MGHFLFRIAMASQRDEIQTQTMGSSPISSLAKANLNSCIRFPPTEVGGN